MGARGGGGGWGVGSSGRADRLLVICGPGTLSLLWIHLSSRGVRGRGVEIEEEEGDRKWFTMTPIFQRFHPWPQQCALFAGNGKDRVADVM